MKDYSMWLGGSLLLMLMAVCTYGWVWNIVKLVDNGLDPLTAVTAIRIVGIFVAPPGVVLGFL